MWLFENLWKSLAAVAGVVAGILYAMYRVSDAQKKKAQVKADREKAKRKGVEATRDVERNIDKSTNAVRERAEEVERENREREDAGERPDRFGDDRLRDD